MRTTLLNPTLWLLAAVLASGLLGALRGWSARASLDRVLGHAVRWPVLLLLAAMAVGGVGSRLVLGFLSPGAYAQEVVAARSFLAARPLYASAGSDEVTQALGETRLPHALAQLALLSPCQADAMAQRAQFYTEHAHTPMLLLAGVPIVALGGGGALYVGLASLALAAIVCMAAVLMSRSGIRWQSRAGLLALLAIAGWQPVLAGVKQGDAVLPAAGLVALTWHLLRRNTETGAGVAAACAACIALPAGGPFAALLRTAPRAALVSVVTLAAATAAASAIAGPDVVPRFFETASLTARTYASAPANYGVAGRLAAAGVPGALLLALLVTAVGATAWLARTREAALAAFTPLGLLMAPVVWSQHLALLFVPAAVLLIHVRNAGSALALAAWAALVLICSLPDAAAIGLGIISAGSSTGVAFTVVPLSMVMLWAWGISAARSRLA